MSPSYRNSKQITPDMTYEPDPIPQTRRSPNRREQHFNGRHGDHNDVHILGIVSCSEERVAEISWDCGSEFEIQPIAPSRVADASEVTVCSAFIIDGHLEDLVFVTGRLAREASPCAPIITLCDPCHPEGIAALMTGADYVLRSPIRAITIHAHIAAYQRRVERLPGGHPAASQGDADRVISPKDDDGNTPAGNSIQNTAGTFMQKQPISPSKENAPGFSPNSEDRSPGEHLEKAGPVAIDTTSNTLWIEGTAYSLSVRPADLIRYFMENRGTVCTRDEILREVWELDFDPSTNLVDVQVYALRRVLKKHNLQAIIHTVRGRGYRFQWPLAS